MIEYELRRSDRRSLSAEVKPDGSVIVHAPRLLPRSYIDRFVSENERRILSSVEKAKARAAAHPEPDEAELKRLRAEAKTYLPGRVAYYEKLMGLHPTAIRINAAKTRFGSCGAKNSLNFSCLLMQYPPEAIDYVVVHELAHIAHHDHSPAFYALIAKYLPDYKKREALLKK